MIRKKLIACLLTTSLSMIPIGVFAETSESFDNEVVYYSNKINEFEAKRALENYISKRNYTHGEVILKEKLFDVDDSLLAYFFTIEDTNGYYIVTAVDTLNPIMEYSINAPYSINFEEKGDKKAYYIGLNNIFFANNIEEIKQKFEEDNKRDLENSKIEEDKIKKIKTEKVEEKKNLEEVIKNSKNPSSLNKKLQELTEEISYIVRKLEEYDELQLALETEQLQPFKKQSKRSTLWDELLYTSESNTSENTITTTSNNSVYLDVPRWYQRMSGVVDPWSACGPTSAAMIMNYYHDIRGFTGIRDDAYFGSKATTINHLRYDMNSSFWGIYGATLDDWLNGTTKHIRETATSYWYPLKVTNPSSDSYTNSLKYRNAISNAHPVAIRFHYDVENDEGLKYHFVVGSGWYLNGSDLGNLMVTYVDPDGSVSSPKNFDWGNLVQDFDFGYMDFQ
ncbi:C39 family peptidase [Bacillus sp. ISL-39]|uniref:C39 family peptidase n=1 Tax=Bacillus sp. ISL-39 TaxID=2819124 RepID=UPI001BE9E426|nr:C39 family peptidase [Bacillus sp. ISL-39]